MTRDRILTMIAMVLLVACMLFLIFKNRITNKSAKQQAIDNAIRDFTLPHDSVYAEGDTVLFFYKDTLAGMAVVTVETKYLFE